MNNFLIVQNLSKIFNLGKHTEVKAVNNVDFEVAKGDIVLFMGPSGSGKTTLLTMLGGLSRPTSGQIIFNDDEIQNWNYSELTKWRRDKVGFIFQSFNLLENLCAWENVYIAGFNRENHKQKSIEILTKLGLEKRLHSRPKNLSGGERQRVAIARALINNPEIIFADEPTANLDSKTGHDVMDLLCSTACREGKSVIIVSHDARLKDIAHRIIILEDGKIVKTEPGGHPKTCSH